MTADSTNSLPTVVMAGMPQTGKSTFLGALYHVLETGIDQPVTLHVLPKARRHLEGLRERWLRVEKESRTPREITGMNEMSLTSRRDKTTLLLRWPDLSGEYFDDMVRKRLVEGQVASLLTEATALLIFIHPDTVTIQPRIHEVDRVTNAVALGANEKDRESQLSESEKVQVKEWDAMMVPGQVLIVDLVQLILTHWIGPSIRKASVIVSAWDVLAPHVVSPNTYIAGQLPLLDQFLTTNSDWCEFRIYGVSALGGDPDIHKTKLQEESDPIQRIKVVNADGADAEDGILSPLLWLID